MHAQACECVCVCMRALCACIVCVCVRDILQYKEENMEDLSKIIRHNDTIRDQDMAAFSLSLTWEFPLPIFINGKTVNEAAFP